MADSYDESIVEYVVSSAAEVEKSDIEDFIDDWFDMLQACCPAFAALGPDGSAALFEELMKVGAQG